MTYERLSEENTDFPDAAVVINQHSDALENGGSQPGASIVRAFPFTFDLDGLPGGADIYTPTPGDVLLQAWLAVTVPFDGTTPIGDFGMFTNDYGWLGNTVGVGVDMTLQLADNAFGDPSVLSQNTDAESPYDLQHAALITERNELLFRL